MYMSKILETMDNERASIENNHHSFATFIIFLSVILACFVMVFRGNLVFFTLFMFVAFAEVCLMAYEDYQIERDIGKNREEMLKELYVGEQND